MAFPDKTALCNAALSTLGEPEIRDFDTDTVKSARECRRWFNQTVDHELMAYDWPFAIERVEIEKDAVSPAFGWVSRFAIPGDSVRFLPLTDDGEDTGRMSNYEVEGGYLLTDTTNAIKLRYIKQSYSPIEWPTNFTEVMIAALALRLAENLTGLSGAISSAQSRYSEVRQAARRFEGRQAGPAPEQYTTSWFDERQ